MNLPRLDSGRLMKYAWPGMYPIYYIDPVASVWCADCANMVDQNPDDWSEIDKPESAEINWEEDNLYCDHCNEQIEMAYEE
jgi:hypothetical protein